MRRELTTEHQLFAENRAFALRDNFEILEDELKRLALLPEMNAGDADLLQEEQILAGAHENSVLYNTAVLLLARDGICVRSVPDRSEFRGQGVRRSALVHVGARRRARAVVSRHRRAGAGPHAEDRPAVDAREALRGGAGRRHRAGEDNLIAPALHDNLPPDTDGVLVDEAGQIIYPPDRVRAAEGSGWAEAIAAATRGASGTLTAEANGQKALFAFSPVRAATPYAVVFAWPWRTLTANVEQQGLALGGILLFGLILASIAGVLLSGYLARPLQALASGAIRIARGEPVPAAERPGAGRGAGTEEIVALGGAFADMERSIRQRDQELRDAAALLEQRVRDRTSELVATQAALVDAERFAAMGKTSAAIAHELKNSLNGLGMAVELIAQDPANEARVARLRPQVAGEIARLRDVVDSLLSFSRSPRIDRAPADLSGVVSRAVGLLADLAAEREVAVNVRAPSALRTRCDAHKVQGVVVNLVKNAIEAGRRVEVALSASSSEAIIEVADDGPGLSPEARDHLFEPFFTTKPNGTGLGLPTSQRFIEAHGGSIEVETSPALGGALFRLRLPLEAETIAARP